MVRAPCCEKMGLKRGPWTHEEDQILIRHINLHGHGNWRALPKQAGLLRCGKSCRLRWTNYLRPDIKRGNFSKEEEETIIELHGLLGNRWSAIATRLPGRTDNEIKNVWHTHLKKRVMIKQNQNATILTKRSNSIKMEIYNHITEKEPEPMNDPSQLRLESPQHSSSDISLSLITNAASISACTNAGAFQDFPKVDENFWSDLFFDDGYGVTSGFSIAGMLSGFSVATATAGSDPQVPFELSPLHEVENVCGYINSSEHEGLDFWYNLFSTAGELRD